MARKKIKLITFDLDDTVWPNHKVIVDAEKTLWSFLMMKVPQVKDQLNEDNINRINPKNHTKVSITHHIF